MKPANLITIALVGVLFASIFLPRIAADYPVMSHRYLADPSSLVTPGRVYVYCSNDDENPTGDETAKGSYAIPNVICVSTSDMKNWTDHGSVWRPENGTTWAKKSWAPAAAMRNGTFYLYYGNGGGNIGVATSNSPTGPFIDPLGMCLADGNTPGVKPYKNMWLFDPATFIDDNGQAYFYFGGNGDDNVRIARLKPDLISFAGDVMRMTAPNFFEAAWVFKRNDIYYFAYSTTPKAAMRIDYMTSDNPVTGFTYRGILADQPPLNNNNNHAAEFEFKGRWYHVYHNRIVAKEAGIRAEFRRNIALEEFGFNDDGTIKKVTCTTDGVAQIGHLDPYARVEGETFNAQKGIKTEPCSAGGMNLTSIDDGDWVCVRGVDFGAKGASTFSARVASAGASGAIELRLGSPDGRLVGICKVGNTGGWQAWKAVSCKVDGSAGVHDLYLKFTGKDGALFNFDWWRFEQ
jgi:arabinoxylan arabinofuranohydrolase